MKRLKVLSLIIGFIVFILGAVGLEVHWLVNREANQSPWQEGQRPPQESAAAIPKGAPHNIDVAQLNLAFTDLAARVSPAVVNIYTRTRVAPRFYRQRETPDDLFRFFFGNPFADPFMAPPAPREAQSLGSGFIINKDGYIITNSHVVRPSGRNADEVMVKFIGEDYGKGFPAEIVGVDEANDVALLKLKEPKANLKFVPLGDSDRAKVGEWVIAIGNPYGHAHSVTQGIVSALGRNLQNIGAEFIQTSASINPGNSGGPLINLYGEVIGINTAIDPRAQGIGFAIPINIAKDIVRQLIETGKVTRGWAGVGITTITPELAEAFRLPVDEGVIIQQVVKGGPADKGGLRPGDIVSSINGQTIHSQEKLAQVIGRLQPGGKARFDVLREGKKKTLDITVAEAQATNVPQLPEDSGDSWN